MIYKIYVNSLPLKSLACGSNYLEAFCVSQMRLKILVREGVEPRLLVRSVSNKI